MLGTLAVMLAGAIMGTVASAAPGPFWYHRPVGEVLGNGLKVTSQAPENFSGTGGVQTLRGTIAETPVEIVAKSVQVKGAIFNNAFQGQVKLELIYNQPELIKPVLAGCTVTAGVKNIVQAKGHLMWKWDGTETQLNEQSQAAQKPDLVFTPKDIQQGGGLPTGAFTSVTFSPLAACKTLTGTFNVGGSEVGLPSPSQVGEWSTILSVRTLEGKELLQHFWNGVKNVGAKVGLEFGGNPASLVGQTETKAAQQEISIKES